MSRQEVILSSSSTTALNNGSTTLHDLLTGSILSTFKPSSPGVNSTGFLPTASGQGGICMTVQEGKPMAGVWAWQKDQLHQKVPLPEKLSCFTISPNGVYCAGGTFNGHIYFWELSSGLLFNSFDAHYRRVTIMKFTDDSAGLIVGSDDSGVSVWSVATIVSNELEREVPTAYFTLSDHTLPVTDIQIGFGSFPDCRVLTSSVDHTVKLWSLFPPALLSTFHLPVPITSIVLDPSERAFWAAGGKEVFEVRLYERKTTISDAAATTGQLEETVTARGGGGLGEIIRIERGAKDGNDLAIEDDITSMCLSLSASQLLLGTATGFIHIHSLPSTQLLRSVAYHKGAPVTFLATMIKPADLHGHAMLGGMEAEKPPIRNIGVLERMRLGRKDRDEQVVPVMLGREKDVSSLLMPPTYASPTSAGVFPSQTIHSNAAQDGKLSSLEEEVLLLREELAKAKALNDNMWKVVSTTVMET